MWKVLIRSEWFWISKSKAFAEDTIERVLIKTYLLRKALKTIIIVLFVNEDIELVEIKFKALVKEEKLIRDDPKVWIPQHYQQNLTPGLCVDCCFMFMSLWSSLEIKFGHYTFDT